MKKLSYLMLGVVALVLASCQKPSEKAAGTYSGNYTVGSSTYSGNAVITTAGDNINLVTNVNYSIVIITSNADGVTTTASGDNVALSFTSTSTTDGDITAVAGTITGNNLSMTVTYRASGTAVAASFTGSK